MMLFTTLCSSTVIEINDGDKAIIGGNKPVFLKFFITDCIHCSRAAIPFDDASDMTDDVIFASINCNNNHELSDKYNIDGYPTFMLFDKENTTGMSFNSNRTVKGFLNFINNTIPINVKHIPTYLNDVNEANIKRIRKNAKNTFITFLERSDKNIKPYHHEMKEIAKVFAEDNKIVSIGEVDCMNNQKLCYENGAKVNTVTKLFTEDEEIEYTEQIDTKNIVDFINKHCGTERQEDGLLNNDSGLIPEAEALVKGFLNKENKQEIIDKLKELKAETYVMFLNRIISKGVEKSKEDLLKMKRILDEKSVSQKTLDNIKRRFNVLAQILNNLEK